MKKNILALGLLFSSLAYAQSTGVVGINTSEPKTTLDVSTKRDASGIFAETGAVGLKIPNLTREELTAKEAVYQEKHIGNTVYVYNVDGGDANGSRAMVTQPGYYLLTKKTNSSLFWERIFASDIYNNIYLGDDAIRENRTVTQAEKSLTFNATGAGKVIFENTQATADNQNTPLKIVDGKQAVGKALFSDANGVASWQDYGAKSVTGAIGRAAIGGSTTDTGLDKAYYANSYIDLPPGKWLVIMGNTYNGIAYNGTNGSATDYASGFTIDFFLSDNLNSGATSIQGDITQDAEALGANKAILASGVFPLYQAFNYAFGQQVINNTSGSSKKYYIKAFINSNSYFTNKSLAKPNYIKTNLFAGAEKILYAIKMEDTTVDAN